MSEYGAKQQKFQVYYNGEFHDPASGGWFETTDPYSGEAWGLIPKCDKRDVNAAMAAAQKAFEGEWSQFNAFQREKMLNRVADIIEDNIERLAKIEMADNGRLFMDAQMQIQHTADCFRYFAGWANKIEGHLTSSELPGAFSYTQYEPRGVVAALSPWNSPLVLTLKKVATALAAGNTVVAKPSEFTSGSVLEFCKLWNQLGFPPGVFNVLTGFGQDVGDPLVSHPDMKYVGFTGGNVGGLAVYKAAASNLIPVHLELGGKSANIVFPDAEMDKAIPGAAKAIMASSGQTCVAGSRLLLQEDMHDEFVEKLLEEMKTYKMGNPADPATQYGPITTRPQFELILDKIEIAKNQGGRCVLGGKPWEHPDAGGAQQFIEPTVFVDVTNDMRIAQEEVFGPVLSVIRYKDEEDAIKIANGTRFGLAAGLWTTNLQRAMRMSRRLQAGTVWLNNYRIFSVTNPFGGHKDSGVGYESGLEGIKEFMQKKSVYIW